jgi:hypothetical protein
LLWAMPDNAASLCWAANHLYTVYKDAPQYVRVLNIMAHTMGDEAAIRLLPRLCFIALQTNAPTSIIVHLSERIAREHAASRLCEYTPRQFCEWVGVNSFMVSESLRERDTPLKHHRWMRLFDHYFDDFERLSIDDRLDLLMGVRGADIFELFKPTFTVYADGEVRLSRSMPRTLEDEARELWIAITSNLIAGVSILAHQC